MRKGDLLFYGSPVYHVAMYVGDGEMVDAARPGVGVVKRDVRWSNLVKVGRPDYGL